MLDKLKDPMFPWQKIEDADKSLMCAIGKSECGHIFHCDNYSGLWLSQNNQPNDWRRYTATQYMELGTPEKLAQALRIAVEALENIRDICHLNMDDALKQINEVLG